MAGSQMITLKIGIEYINGVIAYGTEVPTTEAKADELVKLFIVTWFPGAKNDTGWIKRDGLTLRSWELNPSFKVVFWKKKI
jgi:hypothetical protein